MFFKKFNNVFYLCRKCSYDKRRKVEGFYNWFLVKAHVGKWVIKFPQELYGKRVRIKIEVIED